MKVQTMLQPPRLADPNPGTDKGSYFLSSEYECTKVKPDGGFAKIRENFQDRSAVLDLTHQ